MRIDYERLRAAYFKVRDELLAERTADGHWVGELSSSALATATAVSALAVVRGQRSEVRGQENLDQLIQGGIGWLVRQQNEDGGFGDTDLSHSNIATTYLVVAALHLAGVADQHAGLISRANSYIDSKGRLEGLRARYGIDKTFVVPIMTNLALAGLVDWKEVDALPFELACVPQAWYRFVGMPVVSYAIPALVAIGQARFFHLPPGNPVMRLIRRMAVGRSLRVLRRMQPESGGYLEATPLTSFVVMSLANGARVQCPKSEVHCQFANEVIHEGIKFLLNSVRPNGSWPIDTNLATWNTTLSINALAGAGEDPVQLLGINCLNWLLSCQHTRRHHFTGADPGGFGWTHLSGAVPDADDTPGAVLAIFESVQNYRGAIDYQDPSRSETGVSSQIHRDLRWEVFEIVGALRSSTSALEWVMALQNRDGGWPTFCRGWGKLPFDRSGADLTAHVLRALALRRNGVFEQFIRSARQSLACDAGISFLRHTQHPDGSWSPLWFGNQDHPEEDNPVYGTAKVLMAYRDLGLMDSPEAGRGVAWLVANQNEDGGWGSGVWQKAESRKPKAEQHRSQHLNSSVEETAVALEALLAAAGNEKAAAAVERGLAWLVDRVEHGEHRQAAPIGFYFAKLWYYERLYPLIFTTAALGRACRAFDLPTTADNCGTLREPQPPTAAVVEPSEFRAP